LDQLPNRLKQLSAKLPKDEEVPARTAFDEAVGLVHKALIATRKYLRYQYDGGARNAESEKELSDLWQEASLAMLPIDPDFGYLCSVKGHGWADDRVWRNKRYRNLKIDIDEMFSKLRGISKERPSQSRLEQLLAFAFGVVFMIAIVILALKYPAPSPFQYTVFRIVLALAAASFAVMIPGLLKIEWNTWIRASGTIAVFVIVFFLNPANLSSDEHLQIPQIPAFNSVELATDNSVASIHFEPRQLEPAYRLFVQIATDSEFQTIANEVLVKDPGAGEALVSLTAQKGPTYYFRFVIKNQSGEIVARGPKSQAIPANQLGRPQ
jgi:hypothetical protein